MKRLLALGLMLALALLVAPVAAEAHTVGKVYRIGFLRRTSPEPAGIEAFRQGLRDLGYVEGQNLMIEHRWAAASQSRLPALVGITLLGLIVLAIVGLAD